MHLTRNYKRVPENTRTKEQKPKNLISKEFSEQTLKFENAISGECQNCHFYFSPEAIHFLFALSVHFPLQVPSLEICCYVQGIFNT